MGQLALTCHQSLNRAKKLIEVRRHVEAIKLLDELAADQPDQFEVYFQRAMAKDGLGRHGEALVDLDFAIRLQPIEPALFYFRGRFLIEQLRYADGIADMDRTIVTDMALDSDYYASSARFIRAVAYFLGGDLKRAREACAALPRNQRLSTFIAGRIWELDDIERGRMGRRPTEPKRS